MKILWKFFVHYSMLFDVSNPFNLWIHTSHVTLKKGCRSILKSGSHPMVLPHGPTTWSHSRVPSHSPTPGSQPRVLP